MKSKQKVSISILATFIIACQPKYKIMIFGAISM